MKADFIKAFNSFGEYICGAVPELGNIITHWADPFTVSKNRTIMLPDSHAEAGEKITFSLVLWTSIVERNADAIAQTQIGIMEKIFRAVYSNNTPPSVISMAVNAADYFDPTPQSPNVGLMRVLVTLTVEYLDDCDY